LLAITCVAAFLRGQRRLDLQLPLPIPVETGAPPFLSTSRLKINRPVDFEKIAR
jgi:hypothetical protein